MLIGCRRTLSHEEGRIRTDEDGFGDVRPRAKRHTANTMKRRERRIANATVSHPGAADQSEAAY